MKVTITVEDDGGRITSRTWHSVERVSHSTYPQYAAPPRDVLLAKLGVHLGDHVTTTFFAAVDDDGYTGTLTTEEGNH